MYLGSRPAASVARWTARSDIATGNFQVPECYVGGPVNLGQPIKHYVRSHCVAASSSLLDEVPMESTNNAPLTFSEDFTDYHRWPKSEFEIAAEENAVLDIYGEDSTSMNSSSSINMNKMMCEDMKQILRRGQENANLQRNRDVENIHGSVSQQTKSLQKFCFSDSDVTMTGEGDEAISTQSLKTQKSFLNIGSNFQLTPAPHLPTCAPAPAAPASSSSLSENRHLIQAACKSEGREFLETELVYNRQAQAMTSSVTEMQRRRDSPKLRTVSSSTSRRRVHPVGKFADELVNWMPHVESSTDEERDNYHDEQNDHYTQQSDGQHEEEFKELDHCLENSNVSISNSNILPLKRTKRTSRLSRNQTKRKRLHLSKSIHHQHHQTTSALYQNQDQRLNCRDGFNRRRKQHNPWSLEETKMLIKGVSICGEGKWADIKRLDFKELASRSPVDLKDKWRNLLRLAQLTQHHPKARKVEKRTDLPMELLHQVRRLGTQQK